MAHEVDRASAAIDNWLRQEVIESRDGRNKVLDTYVERRAGFADRTSMAAVADLQKSSGHFTRYNRLLSLVDEATLRDEDYVVAKLIHHSLMFVSGGFRLEATLRAGTQAEYEELRFGGLDKPNGATSGAIDACVSSIFDDELDLQTYVEMNHELNEDIRANNLSIYAWFRDNPRRAYDALAVDDEPVEAMQYTQNSGLLLAASHIAIAASLRNSDLSAIPFLEPKSITDTSPTPIYPISA